MSAPHADGLRNYGEGTRPTVRELYRLNHSRQTLDSFYAAHRERDYGFLMNGRDREMFEWVRVFDRYDLYSKSPVRPDRRALEPFYRGLVAEFFPEPLRF